QLTFCHLPSTSLTGVLRRRSPCACSRTEAPLAQWAPRLKGLSQPGSCPVQTPSCTSAITVQPTEQCVQTVFFSSTLPAPGAAASAFRTRPNDSVEAAARPPAVRPERLRKVRRSMAPPTTPAYAFDKRGLPAAPFVF